MAYEMNITRAASDGVANKITAMVADLRSNMARRKVYRDTLRELRGLSARDLNDLGLNPTMLKRVAYQAAYDIKN